MDKIVSLKDYRRQEAAWRGFKEWKSLLPPGKSLDENTTWPDLPDDLILFLCEDKRESRLLIYHLIMGALKMGSGYAFESLPSGQLVPLLDIYFILMDLARFECMRRLGWIEDIPYGNKPIIDLVLEMAKSNRPVFIKISRLTKAHPAYAQATGNDLDRQTLVRRYSNQAVEIFKAEVRSKGFRHQIPVRTIKLLRVPI